jgi:hypothetical protein
MGHRTGLVRRKISSPPDSIPDRPTRRQSLYQLSYPAHTASCGGAKFQCFMKIVVKLPLMYKLYNAIQNFTDSVPEQA